MNLIIEVVTPAGCVPPASDRRVFASSGCKIGRRPGSDVLLPDLNVSGEHARILYLDGTYQIEDAGSRNGVFLNNLETRLPVRKPFPLTSGDVIIIEPYQLRVSIAGDQSRRLDPIPASDDLFGPSPTPILPPEPIPATPAGDVLDPLKSLGFESDPAPRPAAPRAEDLGRLPMEREYYRPPDVILPPVDSPPAGGGAGQLIPDNYDPLKSDVRARPAIPSPGPPPAPADPVAPPAPPRARRAAPVEPPPAAGLDMTAVLSGVGIEASALTPEVARDFGRIIHVVVEGLMDVLKARQQIKDEFRMHMTSFRPAQNNPLKFSANVEDALHNLLVRRNKAYLGPVEAFEDAFDDIRIHQMAMLAGIRAAFEATLKTFDPERLQEDFDKKGKGSLIAVPAKMRYWELYKDKFSDMVSDADECFREVFGNEFAKAYEDSLKRLKDQYGSRRPRS